MKRIKFFRIILAQKYFNLIELQYFYREYNCLFCEDVLLYINIKLLKFIILASCFIIYIKY